MNRRRFGAKSGSDVVGVVGRRLTVFLAGLLAAAPFLAGMGGTGRAPQSDTIPRPRENYRAEVVDRRGVATALGLLSCGGKTFFPLQRGEGTLMVPFAKVRRITLQAGTESRVSATIEVDGADRLDGSLNPHLLCTGTTEYGNFQIELGGLEKITFQRP